MKIQHFITLSFCLVFFLMNSCSDDTNLVGGSIQPEGDKTNVFTDTFLIKSSTVQYDSLYVKTISGYLGEIYDPLYGNLKSDYLCQFYCQDNFKFKKEPYKGKIDSITLNIVYHTHTGDPNTPLKIDVYALTKQLDKTFYNVNPTDYCDMQKILGSHMYTVSSPSITDTSFIHELTKTDTILTYTLRVRLPIELGQKFYKETIENPASFKNQDAFNQFFPGVYVTTDYGKGAIFHVDKTFIDIDYNYAIKSSTGEDSLSRANEIFLVTKEIIQLNRLQSNDTEQILADNSEYTFLKTPAGIYTRLVIPSKEIAATVEGRILNSIPFNLHYLPQEEWKYSFTPPSHLLLMPEDSLKSFFEKGSIDNEIITYISTDNNISPTSTTLGYDDSKRTYYFRNIVNLLKYHIEKDPDNDLRLLVVPVNRVVSSTQQSNGAYYHLTTSIQPYLAPSGVKLRKDADYMKIAILSSKYNK